MLSVIIVQGLCHTRQARHCGLARYFLLGFLPLVLAKKPERPQGSGTI